MEQPIHRFKELISEERGGGEPTSAQNIANYILQTKAKAGVSFSLASTTEETPSAKLKILEYRILRLEHKQQLDSPTSWIQRHLFLTQTMIFRELIICTAMLVLGFLLLVSGYIEKISQLAVIGITVVIVTLYHLARLRDSERFEQQDA